MKSRRESRPVIAVCGDSDASEAAVTAAAELGAAIASEGWHLICGGGGGVMEAACRGFADARNKTDFNIVTIGVLPAGDAAWANEYVDIPVATGMGYARNAIIVQTAHAVVAIGGRAGTLSEIAYAWQFNKPVIALKTGSGWADELAGRKIDDRRKDVIHEALNAGRAVEIIKEKISSGIS